MAAVVYMGVLVEAVGMRDPVTPFGAAAEQAAVETLLALVLPPPAEGTWFIAEKAVVLAIASVVELLARVEQG